MSAKDEETGGAGMPTSYALVYQDGTISGMVGGLIFGGILAQIDLWFAIISAIACLIVSMAYHHFAMKKIRALADAFLRARKEPQP